ncbi:hypothetical protein E1176_03555, partial [Fulvivirga sp. RKSG066]|nr:hypothetical protein [Fulvivirga aurantia]
MLAIGALCITELSYAQEEGFNLPGGGYGDEGTSTTNVSGERYRSGYTVEPVKKREETRERDTSKKQSKPETKKQEPATKSTSPAKTKDQPKEPAT